MNEQIDFYESEEWKKLKRNVYALYKKQCVKCGTTKSPFHVDHIKPRSLFPQYELDIHNLQIMCKSCNLNKSNYEAIDYRTQAQIKRCIYKYPTEPTLPKIRGNKKKREKIIKKQSRIDIGEAIISKFSKISDYLCYCKGQIKNGGVLCRIKIVKNDSVLEEITYMYENIRPSANSADMIAISHCMKTLISKGITSESISIVNDNKWVLKFCVNKEFPLTDESAPYFSFYKELLKLSEKINIIHGVWVPRIVNKSRKI